MDFTSVLPTINCIIYLDKKKNEQLISNYRVSSRSGSVSKQILKTNHWIVVN